MKWVTVFLAGILFGAGLVLGGMTQPGKVIGFLDFFGSWDPSLAMVMGGAILVHVFAYRAVRRMPSPLLAQTFQVPTRRDLDWRLVTGAGLFGIGWGMAGYCPGPGITSLVSFTFAPLAFVLAMAAGMLLYEVALRLAAGPEKPVDSPSSVAAPPARSAKTALGQRPVT